MIDYLIESDDDDNDHQSLSLKENQIIAEKISISSMMVSTQNWNGLMDGIVPREHQITT